MKPTRNRFFCYGCHREKMRFDSRSKADNFIKFNSDEIIEEYGKAPIRSYYCKFCSAWHVTSNPSISFGEEMDRRDNLLYDKIRGKVKKSKILDDIPNFINSNTVRILNAELEKMEVELYLGFYDRVEFDLNIIKFQINDALSRYTLKKQTSQKLLLRVEKIQKYFLDIREVVSTAEDGNYNPDGIDGLDKNERKIISSIPDIEKTKKLLHDLTNSNNKEEVLELFKQGIKICTCLKKNIHSNNVSKYFSRQFDEIYKQKCLKFSNTEINQSVSVHSDDFDISSSKEYKSTLLSVIDNIMKIKEKLYEGCTDYYEINNLIDLSEIILDELDVDDENVKLLYDHLNILKKNVNFS